MATHLGIWMNGTRVGTWSEHLGKYSFVYESSWIKDANYGRPLSLALPLREASYRHVEVLPYFQNLLPDNDVILRRIQTQYKTKSRSPFELLKEIGRDCVGSIQILPDGMVPEGINEIEGEKLSEDEIEKILMNATMSNGFNLDEEEFRISLAGAQEKTALLYHGGIWLKPTGATPTTHILKLPGGSPTQFDVDMSQSVENEWICSKILQAYGMEIAETEILKFGKVKALSVKRFDRKLADNGSWIIRLPQEDFCQATRTLPENKYESKGGPGIVDIMNTLQGSVNKDHDREAFFKAQILFWLLCAPDGHGKNFSIHLLSNNQFKMTPLYDVLSVYPLMTDHDGALPPKKIKMAMAVRGRDTHYNWTDIVPRHFVMTASRCGYESKVLNIMEEIVKDTPCVIAEIETLIPAGFPENISEVILGKLMLKCEILERFLGEQVVNNEESKSTRRLRF